MDDIIHFDENNDTVVFNSDGDITVVEDTATISFQLTAAPQVEGGGDLTYTENFTDVSTLQVTHGLGKYPSVTIVDSAGDECCGEVEYNNNNQVTVSFSASFSGRVFCN